MDRTFSAAADAALTIIREGVTEAMNRFNGMDLAADMSGDAAGKEK